MANKVSRAGELLFIDGPAFYGPLDLSGDQLIRAFGAGPTAAPINSANFSGCVAIQRIAAASVSMTSIDLTGCAELTDLTLGGNQLSDIDFSDSPLMKVLSLDGNQLSESSVDAVLAALDSGGVEDGEVALDGGTNAIPSAAGLTSKANLEGKGWTVTVNS